MPAGTAPVTSVRRVQSGRGSVAAAPPELPVPSSAGDASAPVGYAEVGDAVRALYTDGITARRGAFAPEWADRVREDIEQAFEEARQRPGGAVGRGPNRYYVEIHPEQLRGFVDLVDHPWVRAVSEAVLGPDYRIVELGFDIPFAGAVNQPWHRDFPPGSRASTVGHRTEG
ncbi:hypothetical protein GCM10009801_75400 [Streptomyces albiaxialis]|uniref:Phytanoyl-CoA dioxygenase n=1 Tax=Streptomyces albiaxialis TaxID=329523 RepID=A0ABN2WYW7_9ACTN